MYNVIKFIIALQSHFKNLTQDGLKVWEFFVLFFKPDIHQADSIPVSLPVNVLPFVENYSV